MAMQGVAVGPENLIKEAAQGHTANVQQILRQFPQKVKTCQWTMTDCNMIDGEGYESNNWKLKLF